MFQGFTDYSWPYASLEDQSLADPLMFRNENFTPSSALNGFFSNEVLVNDGTYREISTYETLINSQGTNSSMCYIGNGNIVYRDTATYPQLWRKNIWEAGTGNGTQITTSGNGSYFPVYVGNDTIVYQGGVVGTPVLKRKYVFDTSEGTTITGNCLLNNTPTYIGNGEIAYVNGNKIYRKNVWEAGTGNGTDTDVMYATTSCYCGAGILAINYGSPITIGVKWNMHDTASVFQIDTARECNPCYIGKGNIVYSGGTTLCRINIYNPVSIPLTTSNIISEIINIGDGFVLYSQTGSLWLKNVYESGTGAGIRVTSSSTLSNILYVGNGVFLFKSSDNRIYRKRLW